MRVAVVSRSTVGHRMGGMETYVEQQIASLLGSGFEVSLITSTGVDASYRSSLQAKGVRVSLITVAESTRYSREWHAQVISAVREARADCYIFHGLAGLRVKPEEIGRSCITLTHGSALLAVWNAGLDGHPFRSIMGRILAFLRYNEALALRKHNLVALSRYDAVGTAVTTMQGPKTIRVIPPLVDARAPAVARNRRIVFVGRVMRSKGIRRLLDVWEDVDDHHSFVLQVVGDGPLLPELRRGNYRDVEFLGRCSKEDVHSVLSGARWSVCGGLIRESFGLAASESLACGTPVIFRRTGALPETIGAGGLSFRRMRELKRHIEFVLTQDFTTWSRFHDRALMSADRYTGEAFVSGWQSLLEEIDRGTKNGNLRTTPRANFGRLRWPRRENGRRDSSDHV